MDNVKKEIKGYYRTYNCGRESRRWVCASFFAVIVFGIEKSGVIFGFLACRDLGKSFGKQLLWRVFPLNWGKFLKKIMCCGDGLRSAPPPLNNIRITPAYGKQQKFASLKTMQCLVIWLANKYGWWNATMSSCRCCSCLTDRKFLFNFHCNAYLKKTWKTNLFFSKKFECHPSPGAPHSKKPKITLGGGLGWGKLRKKHKRNISFL